MNRSLPTFAEAEARNKLSHFTVQGFDLNGVVHAGTNDGEEIYNYIRFGIDHIVGFEPLRSAFHLCRRNCDIWTKEFDYKGRIDLAIFALDDYNGEAMLNVTAGDGKGSSLFMPNLEHPEVKKNWTDNAMMVRKEECGVISFDSWMFKNPTINIDNYDTLVLDTQGNEWEILHGMSHYLADFKYLCIELSINPVYEHEHTGQEVEDFLVEKGFIPDSPQLDHNDWFFVRSDIKSTSTREYLGKC